MSTRLRSLRLAPPVVLAAALSGGCEGSNPNATNIENPIVDANAPKSSEEAAAQSEPPPVEAKGKGKRAR